MKAIQKKIKKSMIFLVVLFILTGATNIPCAAEETASENPQDVIIITPDKDTDKPQEADEQLTVQPKNELHVRPGNFKGKARVKPVPVVEPKPEPVPINLDRPTGFSLEDVKDGIALQWNKVIGAQKYEIYRRRIGSSTYSLLQTISECTYTDKTPEYGVDYFYAVRAVAVSGSITYRSRYSDVKYGHTYHIDPLKPMVALTFDDGPSQYTPGILDALEKYESRATFFEVGNRVSQYAGTVLRIHKMGCEIGNHSYDHPLLGNAAASKIQSQISTTDAKIRAITGKTPALMRPPYGSVGTNLSRYAGKPLILWSIDTRDWESRNADKVYQNVMSHVSDGDIILMHDLYSSTREAVTRIVPELRRRGYQLVTVSEMAQYKKITLSAGKRYSQM